MAAAPSGFALRVNGSCQGTEVDCGPTVAPYRVCCPEASFCPHQYNAHCCPTAANCTPSLLENPRCANTSWDLYDNGGFFCCLKGLLGYAATRTGSNGCAAPGYAYQSGEVALQLISAGQEPTSSSSSTTASSTTSPGPTPSAPAPVDAGDSSPNDGAKIGIGVGVGIGGFLILVALFWFFYSRWRRARQPSTVIDEPSIKSYGELAGAEYYHRRELEGKQMPVELKGSAPAPVELPAH